MDFFKGQIRILYIKVSLAWLPVACLTSNPFEEDVEMISTTTRTSNGWRTSLPTNQGFNIPFEGIQVRDDAKLSYLELKKMKRTRERIEWRIADDTGTFVDEGSGYITNIGEANSAGEFLTFSGQIEGYGEPIVIELGGDFWQDGQEVIFQDGTAMIYN